MLTTLELDDDLATALGSEAQQCGEPLAQTIDRVLRVHVRQSRDAAALGSFAVRPAAGRLPTETTSGSVGDLQGILEGEPRPLKLESWNMGLPAEWTSGKTEDLLDLLEGPDRSC